MVVLKVTPDRRVIRIDIPVENLREAIGGDYRLHKVPREKNGIGDYVILFTDSGKYNLLASKLTFNAFHVFGNALICGIEPNGITGVTDELAEALSRVILIYWDPVYVDLRLKKEDKSESD